MNRAYRIQFCEKCEKREFNSKLGIICSLTQKPAEFESSCESFVEDKKQTEWINKEIQKRTDKDLQKKTFGFAAFGLKKGIIISAVCMVISLLANIFTLFLFGAISLWILIPFILCTIAFIRLSNLYSNESKKIDSPDILDEM